MAAKTKGKKTGRPKIEIDWEDFDKLCAIQATLTEIANFLGCSEDTVERRCHEVHGVTFAEHYKNKSAGGKTSLRRKQFQVALGGNVPMLIWLGKQHLGQKDVTKAEHSGPDGQPIQVNSAHELSDAELEAIIANEWREKGAK